MKTRKPLSLEAQNGAEQLRQHLKTLPHGGLKHLAGQLETDPTYLCRLASGDRPITAEWALKLAKVTPLQTHELRSDLFEPPAESVAA